MGSRTYIGQKELGKVRMISCQDRVKQLKLNHVLRFVNNISYEYFKLRFTRALFVHKHSSRGRTFNFAVPKSKDKARFTFYNTAIHH